LVAEDFKETLTLDNGNVVRPRDLFNGNYGGYCDAWETRRGVQAGSANEAPYIDPRSPYEECQIPAFECHADRARLGVVDCTSATAPSGAKAGATWQDAGDGKCKIEFESNTENLCTSNEDPSSWRATASFEQNFCQDKNWCVLRWCYVSKECADAGNGGETTFWSRDTFTNEANFVQMYYSYQACGTPDCYTHTLNDNMQAPMGCPYDPLGEFGCEARIDYVFRTEDNVNDGCPKGSGNSELSLDFQNAEVISRNLNGKFCNPDCWTSSGAGICRKSGAKGDDVDPNTLSRVTVGDKEIPQGCYRNTTDYCDLRPDDPTEPSCPVSRCELIQTNGDTACIPKDVDAADVIYAPNITKPIPNQILICEKGDENFKGGRKCLRIVDTSGHYDCETTMKCGDIIRDSEQELCSKDCDSVLGQIQMDQRTAPPGEETIHLEFTVMNCTTQDVNDCMPLYWDNMIMTFLDIDGNEERMEELVFHDIWDYHFVPIENIIANHSTSGLETDNLLDHVYSPCACAAGTDCKDNSNTPPGAVKYITETNTDQYTCVYSSPMTRLGHDENDHAVRQKTPRDQWAYDLGGVYTYQPPEEYIGYVYRPPTGYSIQQWHAIWPLEDTYGNPQDTLEQDGWDVDIVDNSKFRTQRGIMFPNLMIEVSDPDHVYRWLQIDEDEDNRADTSKYAWIDPRQTGDVFVRNIFYSGNGNELNPGSLTELTWGQATRAISPEWVSERFLNQRYNNIANGDQRSSFNVSMGTKKRTILFAGQAEALFSECRTCQSWIDAGNTCPNNGAWHVNKVCFIQGHSSIANIDACSQNYCCKDVPTSHGDPIIWTFFQECYDLNKDGIYTASKHPDYDHEVKIAVYNNYMREIQVVDTESGEILLSIDTMGLAAMNKFKYYFSEETQECPSDMPKTECDGKFKLWEFDAQSFRYAVHLLRHDYLDDGLLEGELGYHLDIYPKPYNSFESMKNEYTGLYFENPLPDELEYCPGGSEHW
jgi:hypothetical protein